MSERSLQDQGGSVRPGEELKLEAVDAWLKAQVQAQGKVLEGQPELTQFSGGASNWTYRLKYANGDYILRRPPAGTKAKGAHDMGREFRVQRALKPVYPVVPTMVGLCEDEAITGSEFYVMERIAGIIPRKNMPKGLALDAATTPTCWTSWWRCIRCRCKVLTCKAWARAAATASARSTVGASATPKPKPGTLPATAR